jgi:hypothetical protein
MAKFYEQLDPTLRDFIARQRMFFTGTAPEAGRVNVSPKGADSLRILDDRTVAYLDLTGSGNETAAHLRQNGRLTLMFCSFDEKPLILRLYGQGEVIARTHPEWSSLLALFPPLPGIRQLVRLHIQRAQTSCGYAVPLMEYHGERETYPRWVEKKGEDGIAAYQGEKNRQSIDGLPTGLVTAVDADPPGK